jgi:hypothetical protein
MFRKTLPILVFKVHHFQFQLVVFIKLGSVHFDEYAVLWTRHVCESQKRCSTYKVPWIVPFDGNHVMGKHFPQSWTGMPHTRVFCDHILHIFDGIWVEMDSGIVEVVADLGGVDRSRGWRVAHFQLEDHLLSVWLKVNEEF